ncbi:hypothetical protein [Nocardia sp. NPDC127526]|uniref:hypothetical protein n=1 Tax=Nocardia sp. NPDC127526 TaxID=3345393 RepID=UPI00362F90C2
MSIPDLHLRAECLFSKFGFHDGEQVQEWLWAAEDAGICITQWMGHDDHAVLAQLAIDHLAPLLPEPFTIRRTMTSHNPIRIDTWRGEDWDDYAEAPAEVHDICVTVPGQTVIDLLNTMGNEGGPVRHARDIPDRVMLDAVADAMDCRQARWAELVDIADLLELRGYRIQTGPGNREQIYMPVKLVRVKAFRLLNRGLLEHCPCGCRDGFDLTEAGWELLTGTKELA